MHTSNQSYPVIANKDAEPVLKPDKPALIRATGLHACASGRRGLLLWDGVTVVG